MREMPFGDRFCAMYSHEAFPRMFPFYFVRCTGHCLDLGVGAKRSPHGGGPGAARRGRAGCDILRCASVHLAGRVGFEPTADEIKTRCSTN